MLCRTARVPKRVAHSPLRCQRLPYFLRSNSTSSSTSHNRVNPLANNTMQKQTDSSPTNPFHHPSTRTAHIRLWEPVHNIADVWVIKRAMEKKYGSILETYFLKDFEMPDRYQMLAYIIFRDLAALERIPEAGEVFTILAPTIPKKPIHEIGVKDVEEYAGSEEFQPGFQFDKLEADTTKRVIGGHIRRSPIEFASSPEHRKFYQATSYKTMQHFLNWGGFNPATTDTSRTVHDLDLFKPGARQENARMRAALQLCSRVTLSPIPQEVTSTDTTPEGRTVPTPSPSVETARIFAGLYNNLPSAVLGRVKKQGVDGEIDYEEAIASDSSVVDALSSPDGRVPTNEPEPVDSSPPSKSPTIPLPIPSLQPVKRPPISPEDKQKLESQLHAARLLQKAAIPVRRKQLKPAVIEPVKKPKPDPWTLDQADTPLAEEKQERKGFLAKLAGLFGR